MTKPVKELKKTGEEKITDMLVEKLQHVDIVYEDYVVEHRDIKGYSLNGPYLVVQMKDDTQYVYHMANPKSLKFFFEKA